MQKTKIKTSGADSSNVTLTLAYRTWYRR